LRKPLQFVNLDQTRGNLLTVKRDRSYRRGTGDRMKRDRSYKRGERGKGVGIRERFGILRVGKFARFAISDLAAQTPV
jgi:hypothetical protein